MVDCPCGSGQEYKKCCSRYLDESMLADSAVALMRSRYTAYTKKDVDHLLRSWHPTTRPRSGKFNLQEDISWTGLEIVSTEGGGPGDVQGTVGFIARFISSGKSGCLHEKSRFVRQDGQWLYVNGDILQEKPATGAKIGRNDQCPCGSGRKYKKCCLR